MDLRGRKLVATEPGRYVQYIENIVAQPDVTIELLCPLEYWMRVKNVGHNTLTYDSFIKKQDGVIERRKRDQVCPLSTVLQEITEGHLQIE